MERTITTTGLLWMCLARAAYLKVLSVSHKLDLAGDMHATWFISTTKRCIQWDISMFNTMAVAITGHGMFHSVMKYIHCFWHCFESWKLDILSITSDFGWWLVQLGDGIRLPWGWRRFPLDCPTAVELTWNRDRECDRCACEDRSIEICNSLHCNHNASYSRSRSSSTGSINC